MRVLIGLAAVLVLASCQNDMPGCAYYDELLGDVYGYCDSEKSLCSYGCHKSQCWKQCLNDDKECVQELRGYAAAVNIDNQLLTCTGNDHEECVEKGLEFGKDGSRCTFGDPDW